MICVAKDAYDFAVESLIRDPEKIHLTWLKAYNPSYPEGILFRYAMNEEHEVPKAGCLTMIRNQSIIEYEAETPELTQAIRLDSRIPERWGDITLENLHVFAEWQRRLDIELDRPVPVWNG